MAVEAESPASLPAKLTPSFALYSAKITSYRLAELVPQGRTAADFPQYECYNRADHRASVRSWDAETQARGRARALTFGVGPSLTSGAWYLAVRRHKVRREFPGDLKE